MGSESVIGQWLRGFQTDRGPSCAWVPFPIWAVTLMGFNKKLGHRNLGFQSDRGPQSEWVSTVKWASGILGFIIPVGHLGNGYHSGSGPAHKWASRLLWAKGSLGLDSGLSLQFSPCYPQIFQKHLTDISKASPVNMQPADRFYSCFLVLPLNDLPSR